jgi:hypothetical protein
MPEQTFTITECCALLDIDHVTLTRWLRLEGMHPLDDPRDKRYKVLTRAMLLTLARAHNRAIRDETSIGPRLTGFQRELLARVQALEEQVAELRRAAGNVNTQQQQQIPHYAAPAPREWPSPSRDERVVVAASTPSESPYSAPQVARTAARAVARTAAALRPGEWRTLPAIPPGWLSPREVARELGIAERTFKHQLRPRYDGDNERYGALDYHAGRWRYPHPGVYASELLDPEQQDAARRLFSEREAPQSQE